MSIVTVNGTLTASEVANLYTTPVQVVVAGGAGTRLQVITASFGRYEGKDGDWAGGGGGDGHNSVLLQYGDAPLGAGISALGRVPGSGTCFTAFDDAVLLSPSKEAIAIVPGAYNNAVEPAQINLGLFLASSANFIDVFQEADVTKWSVTYHVVPV